VLASRRERETETGAASIDDDKLAAALKKRALIVTIKALVAAIGFGVALKVLIGR
jgi:hypothetical protein